MKIKDLKAFAECAYKNYGSGVGKTCIEVAIKTIELFEARKEPLEQGCYPNLNTAHGLICTADDILKAGGLSGSMCSFVAVIIRDIHEEGEYFYNNYKGV